MSRFLEGLKTNKDKVFKLLSEWATLRDSDKKLWLSYMVHEKGLKEKLGEDAYMKLRKIILEKDTPTFETLSRCRRKIQEAHEDLRGKNYKERKEEAEEVRKNI